VLIPSKTPQKVRDEVLLDR